MSWRAEAACRGYPVRWWYEADDGRGRGANRKVDEYPNARPICARCPVKDACLRDALESECPSELRQGVRIHGLRGGVTPLERHRLLSRAKRYRADPMTVPTESEQDARRRRKYEEHEAVITKELIRNKRWRFEHPEEWAAIERRHKTLRPDQRVRRASG